MLCTWLPVRCTESTALKRLQCTDNFIHIAANIQCIDRGVLYNTIRVDDEQAAKRDAFTINALNVGRNVDEVIRTLQALQSGGLCAANWKPGAKHLSPGS